jgi:hypothetical protein
LSSRNRGTSGGAERSLISGEDSGCKRRPLTLLSSPIYGS